MFLVSLHAQDIRIENGETFLYGDSSEKIKITGEWAYPTPYVLNNLFLSKWITDEQKQYWNTGYLSKGHTSLPGEFLPLEKEDIEEIVNVDFIGKDILSVGEGTSGLIPFLNQLAKDKGSDAKILGMDLWYADPFMSKVSEQEREYYLKYRKILKQGDAATLKGLKPESFDMVLSHYLFGHLPREIQVKFLSRAFELLKSGGSIRWNDVVRDRSKIVDLPVLIKDALEGRLNEFKVGLFFGASSVAIKPNDSSIDELSWLLQANPTLSTSFDVGRWLDASSLTIDGLNQRIYQRIAKSQSILIIVKN